MITHNVNDEEELKQLGELMEEAEILAQLGTYDLDLLTQKMRYSAGIDRIYGFSLADSPENWKRYFSLFHPADRAKATQQLRTIQEEKVIDWEYRIKQMDGTQKILRSRSKVKTDDEHNPTHVVGVVQDITELRKAESCALKALWKGQEAERKRIALKIHDGYGPALVSVKLFFRNFTEPIATPPPNLSGGTSATFE